MKRLLSGLVAMALAAPGAPRLVTMRQLMTPDSARYVVTWRSPSSILPVCCYHIRLVSATAATPPTGTDYSAAFYWNQIGPQLTDTVRVGYGDVVGAVKIVVRACDTTVACGPFATAANFVVAAPRDTIPAPPAPAPAPTPTPVSAPAPSPSPAGAWPAEPAGFTVINDYDVGSDPMPATDVPVALGTSGWSIFWNSAGNGTAIRDAGAPFSPPAVYQVRYPSGWGDGSAPSTIDLPFGAVSELYFGFWWKASSPWQDQSAGNKLGFYYLTGINDGMFMLLNSGSHTMQLTTEWGTSRNLPPNVNPVSLSLGIWHRLEFHINPSAHLAEWWVDGMLSGRYTDVSFAASTLNEIKLSPTWGGYSGEVKHETDYFWYDHLRVSGRP